LDLLADTAWIRGNEGRYVRGSTRQLPFPSQAFDTVIAFELLEHVPEPGTALEEFHRVCRKNVLITVPDCETPEEILRAGMVYAHWRDRTHCNFFTEESLRNVLEENGFDVASITRINPILHDFLTLRSFRVPSGLAYFAARVLRRIPFKRQYSMTLPAVANKA